MRWGVSHLYHATSEATINSASEKQSPIYNTVYKEQLYSRQIVHVSWDWSKETVNSIVGEDFWIKWQFQSDGIRNMIDWDWGSTAALRLSLVSDTLILFYVFLWFCPYFVL